MWFVFGLVTLVGSVVLLYRQRREDRWVGTRKGRLHYEVRRNPRTERPLLLSVRIDIDPSLEFGLKREDWADRLSKRLQFAREAQVGRPDFDDFCYVTTDDVAVRARLRTDKVLTDRLNALARFHGSGYRFLRLTCRNGRLRIDLVPSGRDGDALEALEWLQPRLVTLSDAAPASSGRPRTRDPYFLRAVLLLACSSGLAVSGAIHLLRLGMTQLPYTLDVGQLWAAALPLGAVVALGLAAVTATVLAGSSRAHLVLVEVLLVGSFGSVATAYAELRDYNMEADRSEPVLLGTVVQGKSVQERWRRGVRRRNYYLVLADWTGTGKPHSLYVSQWEFDQAYPGQPMTVTQRRGALGIRWVQSIR